VEHPEGYLGPEAHPGHYLVLPAPTATAGPLSGWDCGDLICWSLRSPKGRSYLRAPEPGERIAFAIGALTLSSPPSSPTERGTFGLLGEGLAA